MFSLAPNLSWRFAVLSRRHVTVLGRNYFRTPPSLHSYDPDGKTTVQILNREFDLGLMINSYSQMGFRLNNGLFIVGPMAIFPKSVLSWNVSGPDEINEDSLCLFFLLEPKIDLLVLGIGDATYDINLRKRVADIVKQHRINLEVLPTERACSTFNFLNAEGRYVAGALIPPVHIRPTDDDVRITKLRRKKLLSDED
ncbi:NADH dehydrogenase [ubiquinone] 1 alpha subcomplex assembly factor 3 [Schistocerca gregaria]|uniref:NADH dehydrogenase [ubiquinone] 1 alpha subcomplex assembly factor 3 n=1 Tax=Schistocerca gregaria TaxID=7010 RepID=UPI00211E50E9|nr:NADH dehydrogenase [ubiquinone] 1 alpha subcomplex assembly factor 3 [Schistocerca gregaria]